MRVCCADGRLYSATAADWSSRDSLIYSRPLRTEQHNSHWLNGTTRLPVHPCLSHYLSLSLQRRAAKSQIPLRYLVRTSFEPAPNQLV